MRVYAQKREERNELIEELMITNILKPFLHKIGEMITHDILLRVPDIEEVASEYFIELMEDFDGEQIKFDGELLENMMYDDGYFRKQTDIEDYKVIDMHHKNVRALWLQLDQKGLWIPYELPKVEENKDQLEAVEDDKDSVHTPSDGYNSDDEWGNPHSDKLDKKDDEESQIEPLDHVK